MRWHYWHCITEQELATVGNHFTRDERNWKSGSNVLRAFHIAWLMGHVAYILLVKLEKCLSWKFSHLILESLNLAFVTTLKIVRRIILLGIRIHKERSRLHNVHFSCKQINSKQSLIYNTTKLKSFLLSCQLFPPPKVVLCERFYFQFR